MVKKLGLSTKHHPYPYNIEVEDDDGLEVTRQCLVSFSIGKIYKDKIWCDVVNTDDCHLLLRRPWVYDKCAKYDENLNTYSFTEDGCKIILVLLNSKEIAKNLKLNDDYFLTKLQIICPINGEKSFNVGITMEDQKEEEHALDPQVEDLPPKFDDDPLEHPICELNFPTNRDAQHNINLIVDSILPNEATYCINPEVHECFQTQEEGLLKKESIMEGLSSYFVPAFFLPPKNEYFQAYVGT
ncbi:uncharacterized protein [Nicotiana tomentosiformis]|uniref:uncharacterized protein n=1 Tax=Nicotiana tomentosiformis TaxID=4098 RepID=UPI00087838C1|nr:uncharacterized protein LOC104118106 [Nicotiana tomentosiformis]